MSADSGRADFDPAKAGAFAGRFLTALNDGALCLMVSVGHRTGLFDVNEPIATGILGKTGVESGAQRALRARMAWRDGL